MASRAARLFVCLSLALAAPGAVGHGGLSMDKDFCKLRVGPYVMHFTGYQPDGGQKEFCEDIPQTGRTIIVLDYVDERLRSLPVELHIVRDTGNDAQAAAQPVAHVPPKVYANGSFYLEHEFPEAGKFVGLLTVMDAQTHVARFPFSVGAGSPLGGSLGYALALVGVLLAGFGLYRYAMLRHSSSGPGR